MTGPGPQMRRLEVLVGRWHTEGWTRAGADASPRRIDATDSYGWVADGWALLHLVDAGVGETAVRGAELIGYDPGRDCYVTLYTGSDGPARYDATLVDVGGELTWTMTGDETRFAGRFRPDRTAIVGHWELLDGGHWRPWMDITLTRQTT
jgi:hypothetical protein